jgi:hypothetical protein
MARINFSFVVQHVQKNYGSLVKNKWLIYEKHFTSSFFSPANEKFNSSAEYFPNPLPVNFISFVFEKLGIRIFVQHIA